MTGRGEVKFLLDSKIILGGKSLAVRDYHINNIITFELLKKLKESNITKISGAYLNIYTDKSKNLAR
jgi:hypothetical protein